MASRGRDRLSGRASEWVGLAAAPAFAVMAVLTATAGAAAADIHGAMPVGGMPVMYALMSIFHSPAWLRQSGR